MSMEECINMYKCFIEPYLLYCLPVWGSKLVAQNDPIIKVQSRVLRVLTNTGRTEDAWSYVRNAILPIKELYQLEVAKYCFRHYRGLLPTTFSKIVMPKFANEIHDVITRHSRQNNNYQFQSHHLSAKANNSFTANCIRTWNSIPYLLKLQTDIKECSTEKFSEQLKDYYLWKINNTAK